MIMLLLLLLWDFGGHEAASRLRVDDGHEVDNLHLVVGVRGGHWYGPRAAPVSSVSVPMQEVVHGDPRGVVMRGYRGRGRKCVRTYRFPLQGQGCRIIIPFLILLSLLEELSLLPA